ncbi:hypothetical protein VD0004_g6077 [Verticillium dahliae]|nr:hypothetical protein VD0004_g6077 [Verticillium dahliae]PNH74373.1 hypothetical protein VD0001_g3157 [Verticillium dahliae]
MAPAAATMALAAATMALATAAMALAATTATLLRLRFGHGIVDSCLHRG